MLGTHAHTLTLHTEHKGCSYKTCHNRVFRVILKVSATKRIAMQVHAWSQNHITAILQGLFTDGFAHFAHQIGVPGRGQTGSYGETCGIIVTAVALAMRIYMHSCRTITLHSSRNSQTRNSHCRSCSTRDKLFLVSQHGSASYESIVATSH